jgi:hypothetical protein
MNARPSRPVPGYAAKATCGSARRLSAVIPDTRGSRATSASACVAGIGAPFMQRLRTHNSVSEV